MDRPTHPFQGRKLWCPWCEEWFPLESYTTLQTPPNSSAMCVPIYKHGGTRGCKKLFAPVVELNATVSGVADLSLAS